MDLFAGKGMGSGQKAQRHSFVSEFDDRKDGSRKFPGLEWDGSGSFFAQALAAPTPVGAGLLAKTVGQLTHQVQTLRIRQQAGSHKGVAHSKKKPLKRGALSTAESTDRHQVI
ncbi:hypothetical protein [Pseudomonas sp. NPDC088444]|uniref:hypothetical protein n=1 Tax=Pseudomonas sp. NPDC088444 TaxID=3364456 RepID=UPI00384B1E1F